MVKKLLVGSVLAGALAFTSIAGADELSEKRERLNAITWEYRYIQERMGNLQKEANTLNQEINKMEKEAKKPVGPVATPTPSEPEGLKKEEVKPDKKGK